MKRLILAAFGLLVAASSHSQIQDLPLITVRGEAVVKVIPDHAILSVKISKSVPRSELVSFSESAFFRNKDNDIKFVNSTDIEIDQSIPEYAVGSPDIRFTKDFIIKVTNMSKVTAVIADLQQYGFTEIYAIEYRSSKLKESKDEARKLAVQNARQNATVFATANGQSIGQMHKVIEENTGIFNWYTDEQNGGNVGLNLDENYLSFPGYISIPCKVLVSFDLIK